MFYLYTRVNFQNFSFTGAISKLDLYDNIIFKSKIYTSNTPQNMSQIDDSEILDKIVEQSSLKSFK